MRAKKKKEKKDFSFLGRVPESPKEEEEEEEEEDGPFFARFSDETFLTRCGRNKG